MVITTDLAIPIYSKNYAKNRCLNGIMQPSNRIHGSNGPVVFYLDAEKVKLANRQKTYTLHYTYTCTMTAKNNRPVRTAARAPEHQPITNQGQNRVNVNAPNSFIGGGNQNQTSGNHSAIGGGELNNIGTYGLAGGHCSFIGGGYSNRIDQHANMIGGGRQNYICGNDSTIGGGQNNSIGDLALTLSANCSFIGGGLNNRVTGDFSAILGGNGNNDNGLANVHIAGSGITAVNTDSLHINGLWANNIPVNPVTAPVAGTVFVWNLPGVPPWALPSTAPLWIA
jgi:hypothetical protein